MSLPIGSFARSILLPRTEAFRDPFVRAACAALSLCPEAGIGRCGPGGRRARAPRPGGRRQSRRPPWFAGRVAPRKPPPPRRNAGRIKKAGGQLRPPAKKRKEGRRGQRRKARASGPAAREKRRSVSSFSPGATTRRVPFSRSLDTPSGWQLEGSMPVT